MLELRSGRDTDVLDQLEAAEHELRSFREQAEEASERARAQRETARERLGQVESARAQQAQFAAQVQQRLDDLRKTITAIAEFVRAQNQNPVP